MAEREPIVHDLKTDPDPFDAVLEGVKTFEWRWNDRDFRPGDWLRLREFDGKDYTGRYVLVVVPYLLDGGYGLPEGYCVMSILRERGTQEAPE